MSFPSWLTWALLPVYIVEGLRARARSIRLAPATGPLSGTIEGHGELINMLVVGDSSVAAIGLEHTTRGLTYTMAKKLAEVSGQPVKWRAAGNNSATATQLRDVVVPNLPYDDYTHVFISIGMNDLKNFHSSRAWKKDFGELIYALRTKYPNARIYWPNLMSLQYVPALSNGLAWVLEPRRHMINRIGAQLCHERGVIASSAIAEASREAFCEDGMHATALGNQLWVNHSVAELLERGLLGLEQKDEVEDKQHEMHSAL
ncbi:lipase [Pseudovibrio japonicus]|uniref:Lipase n=1 Tax=Pseudovibrio japonicus TaxID=366534 RepID=A0ABQ3DYX3_9HYPH|nr:SGNH/GDSL hydrolase family protein [Pseudovibrio japonicus]GHB20894.1 lipase [Pseudovibrio japonicus]